MKILLIGSGGREYAMALAIVASPLCSELIVAPGNGGTSELPKTRNKPKYKATDIEDLVELAITNKIDLTIVGPDDPLALGIVDAFEHAGLRIFGPSAAAARIEASKTFAKKLMEEAGIQTADYRICTEYEEAIDCVQAHGAPVVIKASGLALGKGVYVCFDLEEALVALQAIMVDRVHGPAGDEVIIEDYIAGPEISIHAFCHGLDFVLSPPIRDHKQVGEGGTGPNTGGMGTIAPVPGVDEALLDRIADEIVGPILKALDKADCPFQGILFPGLKLGQDGKIYVLEFNARGGDPEMQCVLALLKSDFVELVLACLNGQVNDIDVEWHEGYATCVIMTSGGYPGNYKKGYPISGLEVAATLEGLTVIHAGTKLEDGALLTWGGRVLGVVGVDRATLKGAIERAYTGVGCIHFENEYHRNDIGANSLPT